MASVYYILFHLFCLGLCAIPGLSSTKYEPNWQSLDSRPLPQWFDDGKIGIFLHWGVYSVPGFKTEWFWHNWKTSKDKQTIKFMEENYKPDFTYADFAPGFTTELFDAKFWAEIFKASGAKYVVLTSKHHEGFTNWPSSYSFSWNSVDVGPNRDLVDWSNLKMLQTTMKSELASAVRNNTDLHFGLYHSLFEFYNPLFLKDQANGYKTNTFVKFKTMPELYELVEKYHPDVIWSDGDWMVDDTYWNATDFLAWLYNESPVKDSVVVNDRWGKNIRCKHGGFWNCDDHYNPGHKTTHKFENCMTMDKGSWGYNRLATYTHILTMEELLTELATTISCGGNLLLNVGPTHDGRIIPIFEERLRQLGSWLDVNGEAIYKSKPWNHQNDTTNPDVWYTMKSKPTPVVYAIVLKWPSNGILRLGAPVPSISTTKVNLLGLDEDLNWTSSEEGGLKIDIDVIPYRKMPCLWAWVFKLEGLKNGEYCTGAHCDL